VLWTATRLHPRDTVLRRLETGDAAERRRDAHRPAGIRADSYTAWPSATDTAAPEEEPPGMRRRSYGLPGVPSCGLIPTPEKANSVMLVRPISTAPAARRRAIVGAT
jgi:hypothetical protein